MTWTCQWDDGCAQPATAMRRLSAAGRDGERPTRLHVGCADDLTHHLPVCADHDDPPPLVPLVCTGRPTDDTLTPVGGPCRRRFVAAGWRLTAHEQAEQARAAGWSVTGRPMCPACRRPDPAIGRGLSPAIRSS